MGRCVRASGAQGSSRRQPETPHEVFLVNSKLQASSIKISQNRKIISFRAREPTTMATSPMETRISPDAYCSPGRYFELFRVGICKTRGKENYVPVRGSKKMGPKKGKKMP